MVFTRPFPPIRPVSLFLVPSDVHRDGAGQNDSLGCCSFFHSLPYMFGRERQVKQGDEEKRSWRGEAWALAWRHQPWGSILCQCYWKYLKHVYIKLKVAETFALAFISQSAFPGKNDQGISARTQIRSSPLDGDRLSYCRQCSTSQWIIKNRHI